MARAHRACGVAAGRRCARKSNQSVEEKLNDARSQLRQYRGVSSIALKHGGSVSALAWRYNHGSEAALSWRSQRNESVA